MHVQMRLDVVVLDVREVGRLAEAGHVPVQILEPVVHLRVVVPDGAEVALEHVDVGAVEAHGGRVGAHVQLGHLAAEDEGPAVRRDDLLQLVQRREHRRQLLVVHLLRLREAGLVHARVQVPLHPHCDLVDGRAEMLWVEVQLGFVFRQDGIESCLEIPH